jgi:hypothetical protein
MEDVSAILERVDFQRQWGACTPHSPNHSAHALFSIHETLDGASTVLHRVLCGEKKWREKKVFVFLSSLHKSDGIMGNADYLVLLANPMPLHTYLASSYAYSSSVSS